MLKYTDFSFKIFGDAVYKEKLKKKAEGLENISFWSMQPSELAPSIYAMADVNVIPLAPNIYRTALPSKTATCIACQKPILFCIGNESKFGKWIEKQNGAFVSDSEDAYECAERIIQIKKGKVMTDYKSLFLTFFSRTENSKEYAERIVGERI